MLNALVAICGAAIMALEIVGSRVLAPAMGSSIFVWAALIGCFMLAMSLGYWVGGRLSETSLGSIPGLGGIIALAGVLVAAVPPIARAVLEPAADLGPRTGPLVASAAIFVAPALVLATISPIAVRVASRREVGVGRTAGQLYALSTGGSIVGTLATAFWLIPALTTDGLIAAIGVLLAATGTVAALSHAEASDASPLPGSWRLAVCCLAVIPAILGAVGTLERARPAGQDLNAFDSSKVVFRADTQYHRVTVRDAGSIRSLLFDDRRQSAMDMRDGYTSDVLYIDYLHTAFALNPDAKRILVLGLGGGSFPLQVLRDYPQVERIDCVEIDPVVADVAHRYFGLPEDERRLRVTISDARRFVRTARERYDLVVVDAYYADSLPFHLVTEEFFREIDAHLAPGGVVAYNLIAAVEGPSSELYRSVRRTVGQVWRESYSFPLELSSRGDAESLRNIILLASDTRLQPADLQARIRSRVDGLVRVPRFPTFADDLYLRPTPLGDVPVLTDQHAPTDALIHLD